MEDLCQCFREGFLEGPLGFDPGNDIFGQADPHRDLLGDVEARCAH